MYALFAWVFLSVLSFSCVVGVWVTDSTLLVYHILRIISRHVFSSLIYSTTLATRIAQ